MTTTRLGFTGPMRAYGAFGAKAFFIDPSETPYPYWTLEYLNQTTSPATWTDVSDDVLDSLSLEYGIREDDPTKRVSDSGDMTFVLDNAETNSAGTVGLYAPLNVAVRHGFGFNTEFRVRFGYGDLFSYKFRGRLAEIDVTPGIYGRLDVACKTLDWMDQAASLDLPDIPAQVDQREDQIVDLILGGLDVVDQPAASVIETGLETFTIALDGGAADTQRPKVRDELIRLSLSGFGYGYTKGDQTQGGTFMWENRHHRAANPAVLYTLTDDMILGDGLVVPGSRDDIYSTVQAFLRPTRVDANPTTVLFSLQTVQTLIQPGDTNDTIFGPYRDPATNDQIGGLDAQVPIATTDYTMNSASDGGGSDLTANFTVTASATGLGVRFSIVNNGPTPGYVTKLQLQGKGIYRYDAMIEVAVPNSFGAHPLPFEMTYQGNVNVAGDIAHYLAQILANPLSHIRSVRFMANDNYAAMEAAIMREPGDRIAVSETVTGIDDQFTINGVRLELQGGGILYCTWWLQPASTQRFWLWGVPGSSEWGDTTVYGF